MKNSRFQLTPTKTSGFLSQTFHATRLGDRRRFILKVGSENPIAQKFARKIHAFQREKEAYAHLRLLGGKFLPHCLTSFATADGSDGLLLLQEITPARTGDQIRGLSLTELLAVAKSIGSIHASQWQKTARRKKSSLPLHHYNLAHQTKSHLPSFLKHCGSLLSLSDRKTIPHLCRLIAQALRKTKKRPLTLIHGDLRADNLLFTGPKSKPRVYIVDWQIAARGLAAFDLARLLGGSTAHPLSLENQRKIIVLWHQTLLRHGVKKYPLSAAWADYQLGVILALSIPLTNASILSLLSPRGKQIARLMIQRFFCAARPLLTQQ